MRRPSAGRPTSAMLGRHIIMRSGCAIPGHLLFGVAPRHVFEREIDASLLVNVDNLNRHYVSDIYDITYAFYAPRSKLGDMNESFLPGTHLHHGAELKEPRYPTL